MNTQKMPLKNSLCLLLAATIWGIAFVAQSVGMEYVGPFTFNGVRSLIGAAVLVPVIFLLNRSKDTASAAADPSTSTTTSSPYKTRDLWIGGIACGIALFAASNFQQFGIKYTTVGKAGFITACYIVIVPIIGLFLKKKCSPFIWTAVVMALIGLYLLCITDGFSIGLGDVLVLVCAFLFSLHILVIDYFSPKTDGVKLSCIQFLVCGILSMIPALILEHPQISSILTAWLPILYAGILRRCLHFADRRPEKCQSNGSFSDSFPGILYLRTCRLGHPWTEAFRKRASWMHHHVRGYHPSTAAGEIFCEIGR